MLFQNISAQKRWLLCSGVNQNPVELKTEEVKLRTVKGVITYDESIIVEYQIQLPSCPGGNDGYLNIIGVIF